MSSKNHWIVGATMLGVKPAELLNVEPYGKNGQKGWHECQLYFSEIKDLSFL
ncbi:hypothetical protein BR63_00620 [Thermanaerosceptrum fracticalcis]|uniref:Uncharacterized protein n=1 Tax=Thermanaerosceptrum fracticalcis TaxID=1712410 RepID=A0A7G6DYQ2_THEFR|nr:hypothetical protein [Thermanaerosceptrum fracticalcis]QNB44956.1 hypothetical protein BR63_00620 [Thermanaerosceptrum fracticalcis]